MTAVNFIPVAKGGGGHVIGNARFVNESGGDVRLLAGSPAIDAGVSTNAADLGLIVSDLDGLTRPQGAAYDIGAYEFRP